MPQYEGIGFLAKAKQARLQDAIALTATQKQARERGAMYIGGYAAECAMKVILIERSPASATTLAEAASAYKKLDPKFPSLTSSKAHDLQLLFELCETNAGVSFNQAARSSFGIVRKWSHTWRYLGDKPKSPRADQFVVALQDFIKELDKAI